MNNKLELIVISGFLGSGKTTLLQYLLHNTTGKKVGVLVNEFGGYGIDGKVLNREGIKLIEINNGSIFCSCLKADFVRTLIQLTKEDIDILLIENSGMADPSSMNKLLGELEGKVEREYDYKGSICVVDATSFSKLVKVLAPVENQVLASNLIVVNKVDLVEPTVLVEVKEAIHSINDSVYIYDTTFCQIPDEIITKHLSYNGFSGESSNCNWNRPATYSIQCKEVLTLDEVLSFVNRMKEFCYRIKGFIHCEQGYVKLDVVGNKIDMEDVDHENEKGIENTKLVLIGKESTPFEHELNLAWNACSNKVVEVSE